MSYLGYERTQIDLLTFKVFDSGIMMRARLPEVMRVDDQQFARYFTIYDESGLIPGLLCGVYLMLAPSVLLSVGTTPELDIRLRYD